MKKEINVFDYANQIMNSLKTGVLLTTKLDDKVNTMTVSWGTLGIEWGKPIFTVFVRENRYTKQILDKTGEFTINIPLKEFNKKILGFSGTKSGKDIDKIKELGLTLEKPDYVLSPAIKELPLTLECKIIYSQKQDKTKITNENNTKYYPQNIDSSFHGVNKDYHTAYYGEIINAYIIE